MSKILPSKLGHMGRLLLTLALTMSVLMGLGFAVQQQVIAQGDEVVSIDPADLEVSRGDTFTVDVMIAEAENLYSYEFTLAFDPDVLEVQDVTDASFLSSTGRSVVTVGPDIGDGTVTFSAFTTGAMDGPDGDDTLATVEFKAVGAGTSALELEDVTVYSGDEEREPDVEDGSVTSLFAMAVDPEESIVNPGTLTVDVMVYGAMDLASYEFNLAFDPDVLEATGVVDAGFLQGTVTPIGPSIDNVNGTINFAAFSTGATELPDGDGVLATITFDTVDYGESELDLFDLEVFADDTSEVPAAMDGMVYVVRAGVSVVPEASSVSNCDTFEVELALGGDVEDVTGFDINLDWDPAVFEVTDIAYDDDLESTGRMGQELIKDVDNTAGTLSYVVATTGTPPDLDGPDAPIVLAVVTFHAIEVGTSDIDLHDVMISQSGFDVAPAALYDGTAESTPEAVGFTFSTIASPQVAGQPFAVTITAVDEFGAAAKHFEGVVSLSDTTGTLAPTQVTFMDGMPATANMTVTKAQAGIVISASGTNPCGVAITGASNAFTVDPDVENPVGVTIDPANVTLEAGQCQEFTLEGVDAYGNTFDVTDDDDTAYTTDGGGTLTDNEYCAETVGDWTVTGTYLTVSDEADVTVVPGPVTRVEVMPSEATLMPMETQQFDAMCYDAFDNENVADCTPAWSVADADAGTIDAAGLFTAGMPGDYPAAVVATVDSVTGTADVTVEPFHLFMPIIMNNYSP